MILYLDCGSGISGDMLVAALLAVGGEPARQGGALDEVVRPALEAAGIDRRLVSLWEVEREGIQALSFRVPDEPGFSTFDELIMSMYASRLEQEVADGVAALAERMAAAEREVHGDHEDHIDELSSIDTAVDLISAVALLRHLAPDRVVASPPALGNGTVETAHGTLAVPAPAVAALLRGLPVSREPVGEGKEMGELTTPTGAALLAAFVQEFGPAPAGPVIAAGYGAGTREVPGRANVLRAVLIDAAPEREGTMEKNGGAFERREEEETAEIRHTSSGIAGGTRRSESELDASEADEVCATDEALPGDEAPDVGDAVQAEVSPELPEAEADRASEPVAAEEPAAVVSAAAQDDDDRFDHMVLEANIDDMSPELLAHAAEVLLAAGAADVWITEALMKKGRPGAVFHVLAAAADRERLAELVFTETSTFGLRVQPVGRMYAEERREKVKLGGQEIGVRLAYVGGHLATVSPEYEDCRRAAAELGRPVKVVYEAVQATARARFSLS